MSKVQITSTTIPGFRYSQTNATIRAYADRSFVTSDGVTIQGGAVGSGQYFQEWPLTFTTLTSGPAAIIPNIQLDSTTDAQTAAGVNAVYTFVLTENGSEHEVFQSMSFRVPPTFSTGTTASWAQLILYNQAVGPVSYDKSTYSRQDVNNLLNGITSSTTLSNSIKALLPAPGTPGKLMRVSDSSRGVWMDTGGQWIPTNAGVLNALEFGCKGDGVQDDTAALQAVFNQVTSSGGTAYIPPGTYKVSATLTALNAANFQVVGAGKGATILQPTTALAGLPIIKLSNCRDSAIRNLQLQGNSSGQPLCGIQSRVESPRTIASMMLEFSNLIIGSVTSNSITNGIVFDADVVGGYDQNNEQHLINNVSTQNVSGDGVLINNSNANFIKIINSQIGGGNNAIHIGSNGGNFSAVNCWLSANATTGCKVRVDGAVRHRIQLMACGSEDSSLLLATGTTAGAVIFFIGCDLTASVASTNVVDFQSVNGALVFSLCDINCSVAGAAIRSTDPGSFVGLYQGFYDFRSYSIAGHYESSAMNTIAQTGLGVGVNTFPKPSPFTITGNYTVKESDSYIVCNSASALTVTFNALVSAQAFVEGKTITVYNAGAGTVTLAGGTGNGILNGNITLAQNHCATLTWIGGYSGGSFWFVTNKY